MAELVATTCAAPGVFESLWPLCAGQAPARVGAGLGFLRAGRVGIAPPWGLRGGEMECLPRLRRRLDNVRRGITAIDEMDFRPLSVSLLDRLRHRFGEAAIRPDRLARAGHHDPVLGQAGELNIVGWPEPPIGHLHDTRLRIRRRTPRPFPTLF